MKTEIVPFLEFTFQASIIWITLFSIFRLFLSKSKWVKTNRVILYFILSLPFLIPFLNFNPIHQLSETIAIIQLDTIDLFETNLKTSEDHFGFSLVYISIAIIFVFKIFKQLFHIHKLKSGKNCLTYKNERFYILKDHTAFNFLNILFIGEKLMDQKAILDHEILHKKARHTIDLLLINTLQSIFWIFPFWFFIKKLFKENHEYYVDQRILSHTKLSDYLKQISLAGPFKFEEQFSLSSNQMSIFKTRLQMMKKNHKSHLWRYAIMTVCSGAILIACGKNDTELTPSKRIHKSAPNEDIPKPGNPPLPINPSKERSVQFSEVDVYPQFKGCSTPDVKCFQLEMMKFISEHFFYPEKAKANKIEGKVYVGFNYSTTGEVTNISLRRKTDSKELNNEAIRLVKLLPRLENPAMIDGKPVAINYTLPINFRIKK